MSQGTHNVPAPLQDEDKWLKLTKRQWLLLTPSLLLIIGVIWLSVAWSILPVGISLTVIIAICSYVIVGFEVPKDKYLFGSGNRIEKILMRLLLKKLPQNKKLYTKNLDNGFESWRDK